MGINTSKKQQIKVNEKKENFILCYGAKSSSPNGDDYFEEFENNSNNLNINNIGTIIFNYDYEDYNNNIGLKKENIINFNIFSSKNNPIESNVICDYTQTSPQNKSIEEKLNISNDMIKNDDFPFENEIEKKNNYKHKYKLKDLKKKHNKTIEDNQKENKLNNINNLYEKKNIENLENNDNDEFKIITFDSENNIEYINKNKNNKEKLKSHNNENHKIINENRNIEIDDKKITSMVNNIFEMFPNLKNVNDSIAIIYKSYLIKIINIPEKKNLNKSVERFCLITKDNFFIFHSYESYLRIQPPLGILPLNSIISCVQFKIDENNLKFDHFYIEYELNSDTRQFYRRVNNFYLNNSSKNKPILLFKSKHYHIIKNWYTLLNFFINLKK